MSGRPGFRALDDGREKRVGISVDGTPVRVPAGRSLLAGLLTAESGPWIDYFCAIGQCQRCVVRVNGREEVACLVRPRPGDRVETPARWRRPGGHTGD